MVSGSRFGNGGRRKGLQRSRRRIHPWQACVVALTLVAALLGSACGSAAPSASNGKVVSVSLFGSQPSFVTNWNQNLWNKFAEKQFGLKFTYDLVPVNDVTTKQPLLLGSGDYPDVIWFGSFTQEDALKYGTQGVLVPLNSLLKQYAPNVWHVIQTTPGFKQYVTAPNGNIYTLPYYNYCVHCSWIYDYFINIKDLSQWGLSMPRTPDQFAHVLSVFKEHGITPLTGTDPLTGGGYGEDLVTYLMNAFTPYNGPTSNYLTVNNDKRVNFVASTSGWKAGLEYIHGLYQAGDFSESALTQQATAVQALAGQGKVGVVPNGGMNAVLTNYGEPGSDYEDWAAMPPLQGPSGLQSDAYLITGNGIGPLVFGITNKASETQKIRVMKMLNYIWTKQGFLRNVIGPTFWSSAPKGTTGLTPGPAIWTITPKGNQVLSETTPKQNVSWFQWGPFYDGPITRNRQTSPPPFASTGSQTALQLWTEVDMMGHQSKYQFPGGVFVPESQSQQYATEQTNLNNYVAQWTDEFITGQKSITGDWNAYLNGLKSLDVSDYVKMSQQAMGTPVNAHVAADEPSQADIKFLLCKGSVPALQKTYLMQSGVPASDFNCNS